MLLGPPGEARAGWPQDLLDAAEGERSIGGELGDPSGQVYGKVMSEDRGAESVGSQRGDLLLPSYIPNVRNSINLLYLTPYNKSSNFLIRIISS